METNAVKLVLAAAMAALMTYLAQIIIPIGVLCLVMLIDYITGVMCAVADHRLSSSAGFRGIFRKVLIFALVGIGHVLDTQVIGAGGVLRTAVIFFYLSNEGVSLIENAAHLGLPVPAKLKAVLETLHERAEKESKDKEDDNDDQGD